MQIRVVTLRYNEAFQGFSEEALRSVTFGREVLNVTEHFFVHGNVPHLVLVLSLGDSSKYENAGSYRARDPNAPDPEEGRRAGYFCKMDVRKYFDSIGHERLLSVLLPLFREGRVIVSTTGDSHVTCPRSATRRRATNRQPDEPTVVAPGFVLWRK